MTVPLPPSCLHSVILISSLYSRTFSQRDSTPSARLSNQGASAPHRHLTPEFVWPTSVHNSSTARLRQHSLEACADTSGGQFSVPESFAQLKSDFSNQQFLTALGKFAVDDPAKLDRLALANLRENKRARSNLASLHAARSCLFGSRGLGEKKWFNDKPGIATRLKTQAHRRQFRLGLIANLAFYNRLNLDDFMSLINTGNSSDLATVHPQSRLTFSEFSDALKRLSPMELLRLIVPAKAAQVSEALSEISALTDYEQSLCNHLAASEALEPSHAVLCSILRTGADFKAALKHQPIQLATQTVAPLCTGIDIDGSLSSRKNAQSPTRSGTRARPATSFPYQLGLCFNFQQGKCVRPTCKYSHRCANYCKSSSHSKESCSSTNTTGFI